MPATYCQLSPRRRREREKKGGKNREDDDRRRSPIDRAARPEVPQKDVKFSGIRSPMLTPLSTVLYRISTSMEEEPNLVEFLMEKKALFWRMIFPQVGKLHGGVLLVPGITDESHHLCSMLCPDCGGECLSKRKRHDLFCTGERSLMLGGFAERESMPGS